MKDKDHLLAKIVARDLHEKKGLNTMLKDAMEQLVGEVVAQEHHLAQKVLWNQQ